MHMQYTRMCTRGGDPTRSSSCLLYTYYGYVYYVHVQVSYEVVELPPPSLRPLRAGAATSTSIDVKWSGVLGQCMPNASSARTATEREEAVATFPFKAVRAEMEGYASDWRIRQNSALHGSTPASYNWWANPHLHDDWRYREDNDEFFGQWPDVKCALAATLTVVPYLAPTPPFGQLGQTTSPLSPSPTLSPSPSPSPLPSAPPSPSPGARVSRRCDGWPRPLGYQRARAGGSSGRELQPVEVMAKILRPWRRPRRAARAAGAACAADSLAVTVASPAGREEGLLQRTAASHRLRSRSRGRIRRRRHPTPLRTRPP
jgi:hypothetical protein